MSKINSFSAVLGSVLIVISVIFQLIHNRNTIKDLQIQLENQKLKYEMDMNAKCGMRQTINTKKVLQVKIDCQDLDYIEIPNDTLTFRDEK